jgi:chemotaxis protein MotB
MSQAPTETGRRVVIKKVHGGGHHGGAWKVAYADFVTTMMALFIVLWIIGQNEGVRIAVARYFRDPGAFTEKSGPIPVAGGAGLLPGDRAPEGPSGGAARASEEQVLRRAAVDIQDRLDRAGLLEIARDQVRIELTADGLRIELIERENAPFFRLGSAIVLDSLRPVLEKVTLAVAPLPNPITIEGHTDSRRYADGRGYSNWELSADRANTARRVMEASGLDQARVERVVGHADRVPMVPTDPLDAANRRITILVRRQAPVVAQEGRLGGAAARSGAPDGGRPGVDGG